MNILQMDRHRLCIGALSACRLRYSAKGFLTIGGFSEPSDADADDIELWMPTLPRKCNITIL